MSDAAFAASCAEEEEGYPGEEDGWEDDPVGEEEAPGPGAGIDGALLDLLQGGVGYGSGEEVWGPVLYEKWRREGLLLQGREVSGCGYSLGD